MGKSRQSTFAQVQDADILTVDCVHNLADYRKSLETETTDMAHIKQWGDLTLTIGCPYFLGYQETNGRLDDPNLTV